MHKCRKKIGAYFIVEDSIGGQRKLERLLYGEMVSMVGNPKEEKKENIFKKLIVSVRESEYATAIVELRQNPIGEIFT